MADPVTISQVATAGGTLVLAIATFSSVRSANRTARVAERSLLAGQRPVLVPSREDDPPELARFGDGVVVRVAGHGGVISQVDGRVYMAIGLRNGGSGLAVLHGWRVEVAERTGGSAAPPLEEFRRQSRDLFIPAGYTGFWQGAVREADDPMMTILRRAASGGERVMVDLLYGDQEGGQRAIARFGIGGQVVGDSESVPEQGSRAEVLRYWSVDGIDPR